VRHPERYIALEKINSINLLSDGLFNISKGTPVEPLVLTEIH
jgi:hypothetical protein